VLDSAYVTSLCAAAFSCHAWSLFSPAQASLVHTPHTRRQIVGLGRRLRPTGAHLLHEQCRDGQGSHPWPFHLLPYSPLIYILHSNNWYLFFLREFTSSSPLIYVSAGAACSPQVSFLQLGLRRERILRPSSEIEMELLP
jgi:hypothetical protein